MNWLSVEGRKGKDMNTNQLIQAAFWVKGSLSLPCKWEGTSKVQMNLQIIPFDHLTSQLFGILELLEGMLCHFNVKTTCGNHAPPCGSM